MIMATVVLGSRRTLIDIILPGHSTARQVALILGGSALVALSARLTIPLPWVPITGQTYAVLLVSALLGSRRGALALLAYVAEGLAGLPVFAFGHSAWTLSSVGVPTIIGPTAGLCWLVSSSARSEAPWPPHRGSLITAHRGPVSRGLSQALSTACERG